MTYDEYLKKQNQENNAGNANLAANAQATSADMQSAALKPESAAVTQAQNNLQSQLQGSAQGFNSKYQPQLEALYNKVMNREKFNYDVAADPLYQQYKNQYAQMGQMAMQDTIGNASALTGGYGNSWAATAGNQAYQGYLQQLNARVPELYESAYNRYAQEGNDLQNQLGITADLYNNELANYWQGQEFDFNKAQADRDWERVQQQMQLAQGEFDFNKTQAEREYEMALKQLEMAQGQHNITERSAAFEQAVAMMQMGMTPSTELLALAGLTPEQAAEYVKQFLPKSSGTPTVPKAEPKPEPKPGNVWETIGEPVAQKTYEAVKNLIQGAETGIRAKASNLTAGSRLKNTSNVTKDDAKLLESWEKEGIEPVTYTDYSEEEYRKNHGK